MADDSVRVVCLRDWLHKSWSYAQAVVEELGEAFEESGRVGIAYIEFPPVDEGADIDAAVFAHLEFMTRFVLKACAQHVGLVGESHFVDMTADRIRCVIEKGGAHPNEINALVTLVAEATNDGIDRVDAYVGPVLAKASDFRFKARREIEYPCAGKVYVYTVLAA